MTNAIVAKAAASSSAKVETIKARSAAQDEMARRRMPQTVGTLENTFKGLTSYIDNAIIGLFVAYGVVDPETLKVTASGREAWRILKVVNQDLYAVTNGVWNSREKTGSLMLLGFNDGSEDAPHGNRRFTVTEAGALATLIFGTKDNRRIGRFFSNPVVTAINAQHDAYMNTDEAKAVAKKAEARRARQMAAQEERENYEKYQAQVPTVASPVIPADAGLKVASDGSLRQNGRFTKKGQTLA